MLGLMRESTSDGKQVRGQTQKPVRRGFSVAGPLGMFRICQATARLLLHYVCHQQVLLCHLYGLTFFMRIKLLMYFLMYIKPGMHFLG